MTLIVHIPYDSGVVIVSDNQNSYSKGFTIEEKELVDKTFVNQEKEFVVVCAGETALYQNMFHIFKTDSSIDVHNIIGKIKNYILKKNKEGILVKQDQLADIESIIITKVNGKITSMNMIAHIEKDTVKNNSFTAIGTKKIHSQIQLIKFDVSRLTKDEAINFGLSLIDYIALDNDSVGNTHRFGANIIVIPNKDKIHQENRSPGTLNSENFFKCVANLINIKKVVF